MIIIFELIIFSIWFYLNTILSLPTMALALSLSKPVISISLFSRVVVGYLLLYMNTEIHLFNFTPDPVIQLFIAIAVAVMISILVPSSNKPAVITPKPITTKPFLITNSIPKETDEIVISHRGVFAFKKET